MENFNQKTNAAKPGGSPIKSSGSVSKIKSSDINLIYDN